MLKFNACILFWRQRHVAEILMSLMDESDSPKKKGQPSKYATEEERRLAKTAQRREQRRRQRGPTRDNAVPVEHSSTSMYMFYLYCNQLECLTNGHYSFERNTLVEVASIALPSSRVERACCSCLPLAKFSSSPAATRSNEDVSG